MKTKFIGIALTLLLAVISSQPLTAESVHEEIEGEAAFGSKGGEAQADGEMGIQEIDGSTVAQVQPDFNQWASVLYRLSFPAPSGKSILRFRIYNDEEPTAKYVIYIRKEGGQKAIGELTVPAEAAKNTFVEVDLPVEMEAEWSDILLKKAVTESLPSLWIDWIKVLVD